MEQPTPTAGPLTAAMTGWAISRKAMTKGL